jgi:hypothetical protein
MVIVNTSVWIDYLGGVTNEHTSWLDRQLTRQRPGLTDLILCEVLQGIHDKAAFIQVRHDLSSFSIFTTGGKKLVNSKCAALDREVGRNVLRECRSRPSGGGSQGTPGSTDPMQVAGTRQEYSPGCDRPQPSRSRHGCIPAAPAAV